jgi:hypothetical protein
MSDEELKTPPDFEFDQNEADKAEIEKAIERGWPLIGTLMSFVKRDMGPIPKKNLYEEGKKRFNYRSIDDVLNYAHPPLVKHRVTPGMEILEQTLRTEGKKTHATVRIKYTFTAPDGSVHASGGAGEGIGYSSDMASDIAMSYAVKQAFTHGLALPVRPKNVTDPHRDKQKEPPDEPEIVVKARDLIRQARDITRLNELRGRVVGTEERPSAFESVHQEALLQEIDAQEMKLTD